MTTPTVTPAATTALTTQQNGPRELASSDPMFGMLFDTAKFEQLQRVAKMYAASGMVPDAFKNNIAACGVAMQLAMQLGVNPFMLLQKMYLVHGKPGIEAQLAIAIANSRGVFTGPIDYKFTGENKDKTRACTAKATLVRTKAPVEMMIDWQIVEAEGWSKKADSKWKSMPDQMFRYRSAMWLIRTFCPEVLFGMYSADELDDMVIDITPTNKRTVTAAASALRTGEDVIVTTATTTAASSATEDANAGETTGTTDDAGQGEVSTDTATEEAASAGQETATASTVDTKSGEASTATTATTTAQAISNEIPANEEGLMEVIAAAGLNAEDKVGALNVLLRQAGGNKSRELWTEDEYRVAIKTISAIIDRNKALAAKRNAAAAAKTKA